MYAAKKLDNESYIIFGSGSTVDLIISYLGKFHQSLNNLKVVSASSSTSKQLSDNSIREISISELQDQTRNIDVICVDGADEVIFDSNQQPKVILKGHGGALLREKILWELGHKVIVVIDESKKKDKITKYIPIEVVPFAVNLIINQIQSILPGISAKLRISSDKTPLVTDNHNNIIEIHHQGFKFDVQEFHETIMHLTGVVETGIFGDKYIENICYIIGNEDKVDVID